MSKVTLLAAFFTIAVSLQAQTPFPDGGFESCWKRVKNPTPGKKDYDDFKDSYILSSLNLLHELEGDRGDAPLTAFQVTAAADVHDGKYSLKLVSNYMIFGDPLFLPGVAGTLYLIIEPDEMGCLLGVPFTSRPTAIKGFHKYLPEKSDSAAIEVFLKSKGKEIGGGKEVITKRVLDWTNFNVPITYSSEQTPDTIVIIFSASAKYDFTNLASLMQCQGQPNSTLYLDDIEFEYQNGVKEIFDPAIKLSIYPNPSTDKVNLQIAKQTNGTVIIYDYLTRKIGEYPINGSQIDIDIQNFASGSYLINVVENNRVVTTGRFLKE